MPSLFHLFVELRPHCPNKAEWIILFGLAGFQIVISSKCPFFKSFAINSTRFCSNLFYEKIQKISKISAVVEMVHQEDVVVVSNYRVCRKIAIRPLPVKEVPKDVVYLPRSLKELAGMFVLKNKIKRDSIPQELEIFLGEITWLNTPSIIKERDCPEISFLRVGHFAVIKLLFFADLVFRCFLTH
jgi:hypothetical protein